MKSTASLRTFYTLILTQVFSLIGSRMTSLAIGIKVFSDTNQATPLALTAFFSTLPSLISASVAGVFADRWNRRYMMILADIGQAVGTVILLVSFLTGTFELWLLYVVTFIQAFFGTFQSPAFDASITMLVPDEHPIAPTQSSNSPDRHRDRCADAGRAAVRGSRRDRRHGDRPGDVLGCGAGRAADPHPPPEQTEEGRHADVCLARRADRLPLSAHAQILFAVALYVSLVNFLIGGSMALNTPYILTITGSETTLGTLLSVMSAGAIVGGVIMSAWGGTRPRIHTIMPGIGWQASASRSTGWGVPLALGATLFLLMLPLPMVNASFMSMIQAKVPPDPGRVFAALSQVSLGLMPIALMLIGPLADRVFEPAVGGPGWDVVAPLVGSERGAGMGLIFFIAGSLMFLLTIAVYSRRSVREMEATLPDYAAVARADEPPAAEEVPVAFAAD